MVPPPRTQQASCGRRPCSSPKHEQSRKFTIHESSSGTPLSLFGILTKSCHEIIVFPFVARLTTTTSTRITKQPGGNTHRARKKFMPRTLASSSIFQKNSSVPTIHGAHMIYINLPIRQVDASIETSFRHIGKGECRQVQVPAAFSPQDRKVPGTEECPRAVPLPIFGDGAGLSSHFR